MIQNMPGRANFFINFAIGCLLLSSCKPTDEHARHDVLRVALPGQPTTLDPNLASDGITSMILSQLHEGLTRHDKDLRIQPALAKSWQFSDNYTRIQFKLKPNLKWSDGQPIRAQDFVYSWKRLLDPKTKAEYAYFLYDIQGAEAYNTGKGKAQEVGVSAPDDVTIDVRLNRPAPYFPHIPSFMVTYPVRKDIIAQHGDRWTEAKNMVVSGPFVLKKNERDYRVILAPNPHYTLQKVPLKRVEIYQIAEKSTALNLFVSGRLDIVLELLPLAIPSMKQKPGYYNGPKLEVRYVGYRMDKPPMNKLAVRQALNMAIDRTELPKVLRGGELPTKTWLPPGMFGHAPETGAGHQPKLAKQKLAEAGYPNGKGFPEVTLLFRAGDDWRLMAENLQQQWKRTLNIEIKIQVRDQKVFFREIDDKVNPPPMHLARWVADFPDPENFMGLFKANSGNNSLGFANAEYDKLIDAAVKTDSRPERLVAYTKAQRILLERDVAMAPLYVNAQNHLVHPALEGLTFNAMGDLFLAPISWKKD